MEKAGAVVVAAGRGSRMGTLESKQFLRLDDKPVIVHTLEVFQAMREIESIMLVTSAGDIERCRQWCSDHGLHKVHQIVAGGADRQQSVYYGLQALEQHWQAVHPNDPSESGLVLIHDGVRPFVQPEQIRQLIASALLTGAAVLAVPVTDTIKQVDGSGFIEGTPDRRSLWAIQTPQAFRLSEVLEAHRAAAEAEFVGTDDSMLVERLGKPVQVVEGSYSNRKLTTPEDLVWAEHWLNARRKGEGQT